MCRLPNDYVREAFNKKNSQIREFVPKGWVGGHPNPKFLNRFLKNIQNALKYIINT